MNLTLVDGQAVRIMIHVALAGGRLVKVEELKTAADAPRPQTGQVCQRLRRARLLKSGVGIHGGYTLARPADQVTLLEIVEANSGPRVGDVPWESAGQEHVHQRLVRLVDKATAAERKALAAVTLQDLLKGGGHGG
jgi:Rrf2 family protein